MFRENCLYRVRSFTKQVPVFSETLSRNTWGLVHCSFLNKEDLFFAICFKQMWWMSTPYIQILMNDKLLYFPAINLCDIDLINEYDEISAEPQAA
jgi:hypothetical protein